MIRVHLCSSMVLIDSNGSHRHDKGACSVALLRDISLKKNQRSKPACTALWKITAMQGRLFQAYGIRDFSDEHVTCGLFSADFSLAKYHGEAPHYTLLCRVQSLF